MDDNVINKLESVNIQKTVKKNGKWSTQYTEINFITKTNRSTKMRKINVTKMSQKIEKSGVGSKLNHEFKVESACHF